MASDVSSACTIANVQLDDEKEEGEISLEDVSSSEETPPFRYQPKVFGQCPHCRSTGNCHTWCKNMTLSTKIFVRATHRKPLGKVQPYTRAEVAYVLPEDAGKENRRHHHHHHHGHHQRATPSAATAAATGLLTEDLQPISSDSDLELVGLAKKKKTRKKKRRKRSPSFSISPETVVDQAIKESIHRDPPRRHQSPVRRKVPLPPPQEQQPHPPNKSPPPRKPSPQRMKKLKKPVGGDSPLESRGTVTKLLKKVKKLEPFSSRGKEKRSSLKDKLSNIIGGKKSDEEETVVVELKAKEKSPAERREIVKKPDIHPVVEEPKKQEVSVVEEEKKEVTVEEKKMNSEEDATEVKKITLSKIEKSEATTTSKSNEESQPPTEEAKPQEPEPDEDLQLRVIALRSAVLKKHRTRIARAKKKQQEQEALVPRIESPFTSSFNEDFPLLAEICNPGSPLDPNKNDIYSTEDMELDSDMEMDNEVAMISGTEDEANNVIDGDSPYSPTDELGSPQQTDQPMDLSMYTPSKPTETPMIVTGDKMKNETMDGSIFESRPYSPSDATVYDPELPGVLTTTVTPSVAPPSIPPPPIQPPPIPPLGMMPMMPLNPMNLLGSFPMMPIGGFAPVNPMLTTPFIPFTPTTAAPSTVTTQLMEEFGETDLDGSPLVPIEPKDTNWKFAGEPLYLPSLVPVPVLKCNKQLQKSPPIKKPVESLFRNADMIPVAIEEENKVSAATFKPIKLPVPVKKAVTTQPAPAFDMSADETGSSQNNIWPELEQDLRELEELEEEENKRRQELEERKKQEAEERKRKQEQREAEELEKKRKHEQREAEERRRHEKEETERRRKREREEADRRRRQTLRRIRQKSVTPAPRRRRTARTPSRAREIYRYKSSRSSRDSDSRSKSKKSTERSISKEKSDEKSRKISIDDDEQALREILLASLAKRKPNAKRKAALEAAKRKAAQDAAKTTSDKENIAEKSAETTATFAASPAAVVPQTPEKSANTLDVPPCVSPTESEANLSFQIANLPPVLTSAIIRHAASKRPASAPLEQQSHRKVVKRLNVIPASTRAVNNAKRYQNLLLQRKLAQQKIALYKTRFAVNNGQRSESPKVVLPPNEASRFVISLNEDTETESDGDDKKKLSPTKTRPALAIPTSDFEKSVDMFLKGVRLQQELTATPTAMVSKAVTPPIIAQVTSSLTSKTITVTTSVPAITVAAPAAIPTIAKVAVTTSTAIAVPKVVPTTAATSLLKDRTVLNIPKPTTAANLISSVSATPQAVKHLPVSQQEEYRRLKQQIFEYEQLRLQKVKESGGVVTTTSQASSTTTKLVNTSSSLITPTSLPMVLTTSTPKAPGAKHIPKTQLIATISPMSKPPNNSAPIVVTPTKIVHSTANVTTKTVAPTINPFNKVVTSVNVVPPSSKPIVTSVAKVTKTDPKQLNLLSKITETLNSQKTLLNSAANKISSLRVLTSDQINQKTSQIQQKNHCVAMDDLNKSGENTAVAEKKMSNRKTVQGQKAILKSNVTKQSNKETGNKSKDEDNSKQTWDDFRQVVNDEVQTLSNLSTEKQKQLLTETEEKLISKRHSVLDDITEMSGNLRQWEVERDLQNIITAEIISLREQLRVAEEKLLGQKVKLQKIQPKVTLYQKKINLGRKECFRLSKICNGLGQQIVGSDYIVPTAGAELLNNRIKEVATHTQKLCGKKTLSVQSNNSAKTGKSLKSNSKVSANPNLSLKESKKKQLNVVFNETEKSDSISETPSAIKEKISMNDAGALVPHLIKTPNAESILNMKICDQPKDVDNENSIANTSVVANSEIVESPKEQQSTNFNTEQNQINKDAKLAKSQTILEKTQESNSEVINPVVISNATATGMEIDSQCDSNATNTDSNENVETDESRAANTENSAATSNEKAIQESNAVANTVKNNSLSLEKVIQRCWRYATRSAKDEISNNSAETLNASTRNQSETPSIAMDTESESNTTNSTEVPSAETIEKSKCNATHEVVTDTAISSTAEVNEESESNNQSQIIKDNTEVKNVEKDVDAVAENKAAENESDEVCTSSSILNNAFVDTQDKMEIANVDATRTDEQSTNSGPTTVITDNVESDSVNNNDNNNTSSVVNTSLDDYMKEMTVSDEYDTMCSKGSASVTSNDHSITFEEEIRLLELVSESDAPHPLSVVKTENETVDNRESVAKTKQESIDDCQSVEKAEETSTNGGESITKVESESDVKTEEQQHETDDPSAENLPEKNSKKSFRPYESILTLLRVPRNERLDGILCPFALMGTCIDEECRYVHQSTSHCQ